MPRGKAAVATETKKNLAPVLSIQDQYADRLSKAGEGGMPLYKEIPDTSEVQSVTVLESGNDSKYLRQGNFHCAIGKGLWDEIQEEEKDSELEMTLVIQEPIVYTPSELEGFMPGDANRERALANYLQLVRTKGVRYCAIAFVD